MTSPADGGGPATANLNPARDNGSTKNMQVAAVNAPNDFMTTNGTIASTAASPPHETTLQEYQANMRQWHNRIGKQYRNKLSEHFACLQAALRINRETALSEVQEQTAVAAALAAAAASAEDSDTDGEGEQKEGGESSEKSKRGRKKSHIVVGRKTMNKMKVLDMARKRIEALTMEREQLIRDREALVARLQGQGTVDA